MMMYKEIIELSSKASELTSITNDVSKVIERSKLRNGFVVLVSQTPSSSILLSLDDLLFKYDIKRFFKKLVDEDVFTHYKHAVPLLRSSILQKSLFLPLLDGKLDLGDQDLLLIDFEDGKTRICVTIFGR